MKYSIMMGSMKTENKNDTKKKSRNSVLLFIGFILAALVAMMFFRGRSGENGTTAVVTVDGEERYRYSLFVEKEITIDDTNTLVIKDGTVDMISADCPDQICVKHNPISKEGETIICLPNKVVITIESLSGNEKIAQEEVDVIVK